MAEITKIEWADATFNPWIGCTKVSSGCDHCYAETLAHRHWPGHWGQGVSRKRTSEANWRLPHRWNREAADTEPRRVFCASLADVFDAEVDMELRRELWGLFCRTPNLIWMVLTKRPNVALKAFEHTNPLPVLPNVWIGVSVENQAMADLRIPLLLQIRAAKRFLSCEPLLGPINLRELDVSGWRVNALEGLSEVGGGMVPMRSQIDWVICGGESGRDARPMHPDWARSLRDQCTTARVPFFFKQWGEWMPTSGVDPYCHGPHRRRAFPTSPGISWLADGRVCYRDFTVAEHAERMRTGLAVNTRAIEVDHVAIEEFSASIRNPHRQHDNPLGYQWMYRIGKKAAGRELDGREWNEVPA